MLDANLAHLRGEASGKGEGGGSIPADCLRFLFSLLLLIFPWKGDLYEEYMSVISLPKSDTFVLRLFQAGSKEKPAPTALWLLRGESSPPF